VLSGPSGAGKSVLIGSVLSAFGVISAEASLCEVRMSRPKNLHSEAYILDEELVIRSLKKERIRFFLNEQQISKQALTDLLSPYLHYLSVRDQGGLDSASLLFMLDAVLFAKDKAYKKLHKEYQKRHLHYLSKQKELEEIFSQEKKLADLIEFTQFEIEKIKQIDPKAGEDISLLDLKKQLSKIDKINDALVKAEEIFIHETSVSEVFSLAEKEGSYFWDTMNQLRADFDEMRLAAEELEGTDVEALLDRLEKISELKQRYGSIEEAIMHRKNKEAELEGYERIEQDKSLLESFLALEFVELTTLAGRMTQLRKKEAQKMADVMTSYLSRLKLPEVHFVFEGTVLNTDGADKVDLVLAQSSTATLSGGEYSRLKLALMVASLSGNEGNTNDKGGVIVLDEIDANVSGDESIAIADMIAKLAEHYQIFAISHQPHLASKAEQHILIEKSGERSRATVLDEAGRIRELSRIIGGVSPNNEAVAFAEKLLS